MYSAYICSVYIVGAVYVYSVHVDSSVVYVLFMYAVHIVYIL